MSLRTENRQQLMLAFDKPLILFDDINTKIGYFIGLGSNVEADHVNFMIKNGKGLVYVCITSDRAKQLLVPFMVDQLLSSADKLFAVSVDLNTTTTGISAFERADTIRAFVNHQTKPDDLRRPGHIFPLISKNKGLSERYGITEAAVTLAEWVTNEPVAYLCEILNDNGDIATMNELQKLTETHSLKILTLSEVLKMHLIQTEWFEVLENKKLRISNWSIEVYQMQNKFDQSQYYVYLKKPLSGSLQIKFYEECQWGDVLDQPQYCMCRKHFKQFFDELLHDQYECLVYQRANPMKPLSVQERSIILSQLKEWIQRFCNAMDHQDDPSAGLFKASFTS